MTPEPLALRGCTPEPLMGYLKALGVFRLVAEQVDGDTRLSWAGGLPRLACRLDADGITDYFLNSYQPTPILAPWNGGSGFYGGGSASLEALAGSSANRLTPYRDAIAIARRFAPADKPKDEQKQKLLIQCRAELPDGLVPWLDACFVLGEDAPGFFPLLGTGGNDGRLDFTNNFMQRLADVMSFRDESPPTSSAGWLADSLFADSLTALGKSAVGQFNPGGIGGANGVQGRFEADSRVNPWDFVLMIEGALLFAGSVARRLGTNASRRAAFPFSVETVAVGYGSASVSEETSDGSRAELWLPLWEESATLPEVRQLFAEGRAQLGRRQARNAVEFALAVNLLGVSRGVTAFTRYGFLKRNGLAFLAAPLGRVPVTPRPLARLLDHGPFVHWLKGLRNACLDKSKTPIRYQTASRRIDRAIFQFANRSESGNNEERRYADRRELLNVLRMIGRAERILASGLAFCQEKYIKPIQNLHPEWLLIAEGGGDEWREFRLAAALASVMAEPKKNLGPMRAHLEPIEQTGSLRNPWTDWSPGSTSAVWSNRSPVENLVAMFLRRFQESEAAGLSGPSMRHRITAPFADVLGFLTERPSPDRDRQDERLAELVWGLIGLQWSDAWFQSRENRRCQREAFKVSSPVLPPWEFALVRLVAQQIGFVPEGSSLRVCGRGETPVLSTTPISEPFHRLARHSNTGTGLLEAVTQARRRLWSDQFPLARRFQNRSLKPDHALDPLRLVAACMFPLSAGAQTRLLRCIIRETSDTN